MHIQVEAAIQQGNVTLQDVSKIFPFQLDDGQKAAINVVLEGHSVVASAPTGSGKTAIAEAATVAALARCQHPACNLSITRMPSCDQTCCPVFANAQGYAKTCREHHRWLPMESAPYVHTCHAAVEGCLLNCLQ